MKGGGCGRLGVSCGGRGAVGVLDRWGGCAV